MKLEAVNYNNNIAYAGRNGKDDDQKKVTTSEVAAVTGTSAATATASRTGAWKTFKQFGFDTQKMRNVSAETKEALQFAQKTGQEAKGLWAGLSKNAKRFTDAIIDWGHTVKANRFIKPILESGVYKRTAGLIGGAVAFFVFVTGVGNMTKKVVNGVQDRSDKFMRMAIPDSDSYSNAA